MFPQHVLKEFARRETQAREAKRQDELHGRVSPYLLREHVTYEQAMKGVKQ